MAETSNVLRVNIVTPDGLVYDHHAKMLVVHSVAGELGIMANHEPIVTPLEIGKLTFSGLIQVIITTQLR